jgi:hypothetical protein
MPGIGLLKWIEVSLEEPFTLEDRQSLLYDSDATEFGSLERRARVTVYSEPHLINSVVFQFAVSPKKKKKKKKKTKEEMS